MTRSPGVFVGIVLNSPRISAGASGLGSNVSRWLGPPNWKSMMTLFAVALRGFVAFSARRIFGSVSPVRPTAPMRNKARRESWWVRRKSSQALSTANLAGWVRARSGREPSAGRPNYGAKPGPCAERLSFVVAIPGEGGDNTNTRRGRPSVSYEPGMTRHISIMISIVVASSSQVAAAEPVSFARGRADPDQGGLQRGACHGNPTGKNGFRLSLRGYDPAIDIQSLAKELGGRRIDRIAPDRSLVLEKATARTAHEGGRRLDPDGDLYRLVRTGSRREPSMTANGRRGRFADRHAIASSLWTRRPARWRLRVVAAFPDGTKRDVTHLTRFTVNDELAARVDPTAR